MMSSNNTVKIFIILTFLICWTRSAISQQININRIEEMPNIPEPYQMRDWKQVTKDYDKFVFDFSKTGQYLPLIWWRTSIINYPEHLSFGLHSYVGTKSPNSAEAINVLPAVISASLVGIDKSNQGGHNWVLMCEEYFNKANGVNVYLNHPTESDWNDWWYDTMPNLFFYQLYNLYPHTGDFDYQFASVADLWLAAIFAMEGRTTPWHIPNMNYRAFDLKTMTPKSAYPTEPEAAGAIAWLLYNAFSETGESEYRIGAELAMEFLNQRNTNPSYELQLPYGAYIAARMNAESGTEYNIEKIVNWCFTTLGNVRNWGAIVGNWGGYECSGLIGEVSQNDYAFTMNVFEQIGALVPLVRYDERFARAIGKWVLNAANASRLFYSDFLPDNNQDSEVWAHQYDSLSVIAYEALHEYNPQNSSVRPYATGDAVAGGWGNTNLSLYGASHVGILGGIIDTTDIRMILRLNTLITDYFHNPAYPTYLFYNPYEVDTVITLNSESQNYDLYDIVSNQFILTNVSGQVSVALPADGVLLLAETPTGGTISYQIEKMLINDIVVDYHSGQPVSNYPPRIKSLTALPELIPFEQTSMIYCSATDKDNDTLNYVWSATGGDISGTGNIVSWTAPGLQETFIISCLVSDGKGGQDSTSVTIEVTEIINHDPEITKLTAEPGKIDLSGITYLSCTAFDQDGDSLIYFWSTSTGDLQTNGANATWTAPSIEGNYYVICMVQDTYGGHKKDSIGIVVRDFSQSQTGKLIAYYPFNNNANDESGNNYHGTVYGATLTQDRKGNPNSAYYFDGVNDYIRITNNDSLNIQAAMSINFWMNIGQFYTREAFPISHGSWENRWKVSIIPEKKLRWTIKTDNPVNSGIIDLDTETILNTNTWYNVTVFYDGSDFEIYINGNLDNFSSWIGNILKTSYDMTIGQMLPNNTNYNFKGVLDDIRIYNYGLSVQEIMDLAGGDSGLKETKSIGLPEDFVLFQNFPNPFNSNTNIRFYIPYTSEVQIKIFDIQGREVTTLLNQRLMPGNYEVDWSPDEQASGIYFYQLRANNFIQSRKMILMR
jgi:hypothetical protein